MTTVDLRYRALGWLGTALILAAGLGLALPVEDAALRAVVDWIRPTNRFYDPMRVEISLLILGLFLVWVRAELAARYPDPANLPPFHWHPHFLAGLAVAPFFWIGHHELLGIPGVIWAEDGPMEYLTVVLLLLAAWLAVRAMRRPDAGFTKAERGLLIAFAVGLVFLAGEEISWGQRILGIETPEALKQSNVQGEINLHNLTVGWNEVARMGIACALSALIWLNESDRMPFLRGRLDGLKPPVGLFFWLPLLLIPGHLYDELFEQIVSFAIVAYALAIDRRARDRST